MPVFPSRYCISSCLTCVCKSAMDAKNEIMDILQKVWTKLQGLPQATSLELGAFFVLLLFVAMVIFMVVLSCVHCCCCGKPKYQGSRVQPLQPA